jgi:peptidoglycan lytic transglycosylase D
VRQGDSLWIIAKRYRTTTKRIQALNNLKTTRLHKGQILKISEPKGRPNTKGLQTYIVKKGDSPFTIAKKHNTPLERFLHLNQLSSNSSIYPGQTLYID